MSLDTLISKVCNDVPLTPEDVGEHLDKVVSYKRFRETQPELDAVLEYPLLKAEFIELDSASQEAVMDFHSDFPQYMGCEYDALSKGVIKNINKVLGGVPSQVNHLVHTVHGVKIVNLVFDHYKKHRKIGSIKCFGGGYFQGFTDNPNDSDLEFPLLADNPRLPIRFNANVNKHVECGISGVLETIADLNPQMRHFLSGTAADLLLHDAEKLVPQVLEHYLKHREVGSTTPFGGGYFESFSKNPNRSDPEFSLLADNSRLPTNFYENVKNNVEGGFSTFLETIAKSNPEMHPFLPGNHSELLLYDAEILVPEVFEQFLKDKESLKLQTSFGSNYFKTYAGAEHALHSRNKLLENNPRLPTRFYDNVNYNVEGKFPQALAVGAKHKPELLDYLAPGTRSQVLQYMEADK